MESQRLLLRSMSVVLDQEGLASQAVNILIKYFKTYKDGVGSQSSLSSSSSSSSSSETYPPDVLELLSTVVINAIKSHVSAFSDRTTLLEVRKAKYYYVLLLKSIVVSSFLLCHDSYSSCTMTVDVCMHVCVYVYKCNYLFIVFYSYYCLLVSQYQVSSKQLSPSC